MSFSFMPWPLFLLIIIGLGTVLIIWSIKSRNDSAMRIGTTGNMIMSDTYFRIASEVSRWTMMSIS
jgi:hypothetical protein